MTQLPSDTEDVSLKLSDVLSDIGVNDRIVLKRRRSMLFRESVRNVVNRATLNGLMTSYIMGSQSEGTTTEGLNSDTDCIICFNCINLIQDWSDWKHGYINLLMIQDDSVFPGYCKLQLLRGDAPLPATDIPLPFWFVNRNGRILLKNNLVSIVILETVIHFNRNGPAFTPENNESDCVIAFPCATWPIQARPWFDQQGVGRWPSDELKRNCCNTGCFVVGVGRAGSENEEVEWRVSTTLAERYLMFSLNITQIRCYVLMKMIKKSFIDPLFKDVISTYMCKTVLFHCIENNQPDIWRENNLLVCLSIYASSLYEHVQAENCPHFIIRRNNLMRGKILPEAKPHVLEILQHIIGNDGSFLLAIEYDDLGTRLQQKFNNLCQFRQTCDIISTKLLLKNSCIVQFYIHIYIFAIQSSREPIQELKQFISKLLSIGCHNELERAARDLLAFQLGSSLGYAIASLSIQQNNIISAEALSWITPCLNTDLASSKLKLASAFYCTRQYERSEFVLSKIAENYDPNIVVSLRYSGIEYHVLGTVCDQYDEEDIQIATAKCIQFLPCEIHCVPKELKQEMFRSTVEDKAFRGIGDFWMDWAVVDSLTFLYFLQYKIYHKLGRQEQKQKALANLVKTIEQELGLGHRETAWNLLGQCLEQEHRPINALQCYSLSLNVRRRNNAAKIHICRLLNNMYHHQQ